MDDKPSEKHAPDTRSVGEAPDVLVGDIDSPALASVRRPHRRRRLKKSLIFGVCASIIGLGSLAASAWIYTDMRREMVRVSTEIAQLRLSLDLYVQRGSAAAPAPATAKGPDTETLSALENRLAILEQNWRGAAAAAGAVPQAVPTATGPAVASESDGDCLPSGMRLLVAAGDSYPVCGTETTIEVMNVSNGYISLTDGTTVPSGGTMPLPGTACMIAVTSGGDEATTGFAEIRVTC